MLSTILVLRKTAKQNACLPLAQSRDQKKHASPLGLANTTTTGAWHSPRNNGEQTSRSSSSFFNPRATLNSPTTLNHHFSFIMKCFSTQDMIRWRRQFPLGPLPKPLCDRFYREMDESVRELYAEAAFNQAQVSLTMAIN